MPPSDYLNDASVASVIVVSNGFRAKIRALWNKLFNRGVEGHRVEW